MMLFLLLSAQAPAVNTPPPPVLIIPPPAPPGVHPEIVREPEARQPIQSLFSPYDYPQALNGTGERGVVAVILTIDASGRVASCGIQQSSSNELSRATCNTLRRRARFTPAADAGGNPVIGQIPVQVDWDEVFRRFQ